MLYSAFTNVKKWQKCIEILIGLIVSSHFDLYQTRKRLGYNSHYEVAFFLLLDPRALLFCYFCIYNNAEGMPAGTLEEYLVSEVKMF